MKQEWEPDELIESWTLVEADWRLVGNKSGATRLGFAVLLKFYEIEGRFPAYPEEVPGAAVDYLAGLVKVEPVQFGKYAWSGSTIEYHRSQIRAAFGTRPPSEDDEERWAVRLAGEVCPVETRRERLAAALLRRCRSENIEPPAEGQVERVVGSALRRHEEAFAAVIVVKLGPGVCTRLGGRRCRSGQVVVDGGAAAAVLRRPGTPRRGMKPGAGNSPRDDLERLAGRLRRRGRGGLFHRARAALTADRCSTTRPR